MGPKKKARPRCKLGSIQNVDNKKKEIWFKIYMEWLRLYIYLCCSFLTHFESAQSEFGWRNYEHLKFIMNKYTITCNSAAISYM
jgi:hypothetical protein